MNRITIGGVLAGVTLAVLAPLAPAQAAETITLRPGDLNCAETRSGGHNVVGGNDVHVYTDSNTSVDKAACYFDRVDTLPVNASFQWADTSEDDSTARPGLQIVFDGNGILNDGISDYNILVGERVYGDDFWLTGSSSAEAKAADPSGAENGGSGSEWFGTLDEWKAAMPDAQMYAGGWSLGSGVKGDGYIKSMTYGGNTYIFTNAAETTAVVPNVYSSKSKNETRESVQFRYGTQEAGDNETLLRKVTFTVKVDDKTVDTSKVGFGSSQTYNRLFAKNTGPHTAALLVDGDVAERLVIHTGPRR